MRPVSALKELQGSIIGGALQFRGRSVRESGEGIRQFSLHPFLLLLLGSGCGQQTAVFGLFGRLSPGAFLELVIKFRILEFEVAASNAVRYDLNGFRGFRELVGRVPIKARWRRRSRPAYGASSGVGRLARKFGFAVLLYGSDGALWNAVVSARSTGALDQVFLAPAQDASLGHVQQA